MQSILGKLRIITLSNIHTLLDHGKGLNSIGEYEQYVRDLQTGRDHLDGEAARSRGRKSYLDQQIAAANARCALADEQINILLSDDDASNDSAALPLQIQFDNAKRQIAQAEKELETVNAMVAKYDQAVQQIDGTLNEAKGKLEALRSMDNGTKAAEKAAKVLEGIDLGSAPDTSGVESRMSERAAVASNALDRNLGRVTNAVGGITPVQASAQAALTARKKALQAQKSGNTSQTA
jgi:phage shock protein A